MKLTIGLIIAALIVGIMIGINCDRNQLLSSQEIDAKREEYVSSLENLNSAKQRRIFQMSVVLRKHKLPVPPPE